MLFYRCDPTFRYIKPVEAPAGTFGDAVVMRKKRIFRSMDAARSAQRSHQKAVAKKLAIRKKK